MLFIYLFIFVAYNGSMREASCASIMPAVIIEYLSFINCSIYLLLFIYFIMPAAVSCVKHPAAV
jgi:hypothetical protein